MATTEQQFTIEIPADHECDMRSLAELDGTSVEEQTIEAIKAHNERKKRDSYISQRATDMLNELFPRDESEEVTVTLGVDVLDDLRRLEGRYGPRFTTEELAYRAIITGINHRFQQED